jgi:hypothetical protein
LSADKHAPTITLPGVDFFKLGDYARGVTGRTDLSAFRDNPLTSTRRYATQLGRKETGTIDLPAQDV